MHKLPELPYKYDALEPYIDAKTMEIHHTKHHQSYVDNLNKVISSSKALSDLSAEDLLKNIPSVPSEIRQAVINSAGGHVNHSFFWKIMTSEKESGKPGSELLAEIDIEFGSLEKFKEEFSVKAMSVFGSGWAFLIRTKEGKLKLKRHSFQNSPLLQGNTPLLGIDLWEHAYYLKYQNRRSEYVDAWWNIVNWQQVDLNFKSALI